MEPLPLHTSHLIRKAARGWPGRRAPLVCALPHTRARGRMHKGWAKTLLRQRATNSPKTSPSTSFAKAPDEGRLGGSHCVL